MQRMAGMYRESGERQNRVVVVIGLESPMADTVVLLVRRIAQTTWIRAKRQK